MLFRRIDTGEVIDVSMVYLMFPNVSFPVLPWNHDVLSRFGLEEVIDTPAPIATEYTIVEQDGWIKLPTGKWTQQWITRDRFTESERQQYDADMMNLKWQSIRQVRDKFLSETDWTQLPDSPLSDLRKEQYKVYRVALRNITRQSSPYTIQWPVI